MDTVTNNGKIQRFGTEGTERYRIFSVRYRRNTTKNTGSNMVGTENTESPTAFNKRVRAGRL